MSYLLLCAASLLLSVLTCLILFGKRNAVESTVLGVIWFFGSHVLCSMGLFVLDAYTMFRTICLTTALHTVLAGIVVWRCAPKPFSLRTLFSCDFSLKPVLIPLLVCLAALPFVSLKNEYFGMGQDEGVYQTQAVFFLYGITDRQLDLEEYSLLETEEEQEAFRAAISDKLGGWDISPEDYPDTSYDRTVSAVSGIIHGIPTYSALLAMWAELFGLEQMLSIETVFYVCLIFLVYFVCRNLRLGNAARLCACIGTALSPIVIWVAKAALTEMMLALLPLLFLYFLTDETHLRRGWLSVLPVAVFACYHVSVYTMMPLFLMVYGGLYFFTGKKQFAVLLPVTVLGYLASFFMMRQVQPFYTMNNYRQVFVGGVNVYNLPVVVTAVCLILLAACGVFVLLTCRIRHHAKKDSGTAAADSPWFRGFLSLLILLPLLFIVIKTLRNFENWSDVTYLTFWSFLGNGGAVVLPLAILAAVICPKFYAADNGRLVTFLMFFYCVLIYSAFLRYDIQYYYYYDRYLAPFVPIAVIFAMLTLNRFGGKLLFPATCVGLLLIGRYDYFLMSARDDSRMEWRIIEDVAALLEEDSCVLLDRDFSQTFWLPLKAMTDADVYPEDEENREEQLARLSSQYAHVLYLTDTADDSGTMKIRYQNSSLHSEDDLATVGKLFPMSYQFWVTKQPVYLYSYQEYRTGYSATSDYEDFTGFSDVETDFCWSCEETAVIHSQLYPADYTMTITFGNAIPLELFEEDCYTISVSVNGEALGTITITEDRNGGEFSLTVPEELLQSGENTVELTAPLWSASEISPEDSRELGFPLKSVVFTPAA